MREPLVDFTQTVDSIDIPVKRPDVTAAYEASSKGGTTTLERYGVGFFSDIGKQGGDALAATRSHEFYDAIGRKGGSTTKAKHGRAHYRAMGAKGGAVTKAKGSDYYRAISRKRWDKQKGTQP